MRALERVAKEKGLVKPESLQKKASVTKKADYTPSADFMENIFKLCAGLRAQGLDKAASELEVNYLNYKRAQTLYETSKEKGEDLVQSAHPKGSHKLEGVEGEEATVEDILDQQLKMLKVIEKKPTGKLSSAAQVIRAVKRALGQQMPPIPENIDQLDEDGMVPFRQWGAFAQLKQIPGVLAKARGIIQNKMNTTTLAGSFEKDYAAITAKINNMNTDSVTVKDVDEIIGHINSMQGSINLFSKKDLFALTPGGLGVLPTALRHVGDIADIATGDWDQALRDQISGILTNALKYATTARANIRGSNDAGIKASLKKMQASKAAEPQPVADTQKKIEALAAQFEAFAGQIASDDPRDKDAVVQTQEWLKGKAGALRQLAQKYQGEANKEAVDEIYLGTLGKYQTALNSVRKTWS